MKNNYLKVCNIFAMFIFSLQFGGKLISFCENKESPEKQVKILSPDSLN